MLDADVPDHGLVLGEDVDTRGQGPLLGPGGHCRHEAPDRDVLLCGVTRAAVGEPVLVVLHLPITKEQRQCVVLLDHSSS